MAAVHNLTIDQGATFTQLFQRLEADGTTPIDLTGFSARMQIRARVGGKIIIELTTENNRIVLTPAEGYINLVLTAAETAALPAGEYVYDLELVNGATVIRLVQGSVTIDPEVTK